MLVLKEHLCSKHIHAVHGAGRKSGNNRDRLWKLIQNHQVIHKAFHLNYISIQFKIIVSYSEKTNAKVKTLLFDMLNPLLNEPEQISTKVLDILLARIIEPQKSNNKEAYNLAVNLIKKGNEHFEYFVQNVNLTIMSFKFYII